MDVNRREQARPAGEAPKARSLRHATGMTIGPPPHWRIASKSLTASTRRAWRRQERDPGAEPLAVTTTAAARRQQDRDHTADGTKLVS